MFPYRLQVQNWLYYTTSGSVDFERMVSQTQDCWCFSPADLPQRYSALPVEATLHPEQGFL